MTQPFHIKLADVKREGRKAYEEGRLVAQNKTGSTSMYLHEPTKSVCVVGAVLPPDLAKKLDAGAFGSGIYTVKNIVSEAGLENHLIRVDEDELKDIHELQNLHDMWVGHEPGCIDELNFKKALYAE